ncbi:MAG: nucleotidyltransferase domain-containing protein [Thermoprotei archaeon]|nr:MAG: nucleotidyltransferase domain-containing protein [Thermoprotei archaeon]
MPLRILEDKRKFEFHKLTCEEKNKVIKLLSRILSNRREILLAVIFGGFVKHKIFRDVDIAVFTGYTIPYDKVELYEEELSENLESIIKLPVDVRVIDYAPSWFRIKALDGIVLVEREPALIVRLKFKAHQEIEDIKAKIHRIPLKDHT